MPVKFFSERILFHLTRQKVTAEWIEKVIRKEGYKLGEINVIFCSDKYLLHLNKAYLNHDYYTDILTFDLSAGTGPLEGELFISIPRIRENAKVLKADFSQELHRVIVHGVLHLMGYKDKKSSDKARMREKEDAYLSLRMK